MENFNDFKEPIENVCDFEKAIENFNDFEETIENFNGFWGHQWCHTIIIEYFYRTQVYLGSDLWVQVSLSN